MKKLLTLTLAMSTLAIATAQNIGINSTGATPDASAILDVTATDKGMLIPRMTEVQRTTIATPATGLLVYQTNNTDGFWYYDGAGWESLSGGGSGEFQSIGGVVQSTTSIAGDDFVFGSTSLDDISGTTDDARMFFDKSKGAFRAGKVTGTYFDDVNVGSQSAAFGDENVASGSGSVAMGTHTEATGDWSMAMGSWSNANGDGSVALGNGTISSSYYSIAMGGSTVASGAYSTAMGLDTNAPSYGETTIGLNSTLYTPSKELGYDANDRLFTIGNGRYEEAKSDALVMLKNGSTGLGISTPDPSSILDISSTERGLLTPRMTEAQRLAIASPASGLLVYQMDGASGFWYYNGTVWTSLSEGNNEFRRSTTRGLVYNSTSINDDFVFGSSSLESGPSGGAARFFFDKGRGAFRAGEVDGSQWNWTNRGDNSIAMGYNTLASEEYSTSIGFETEATGRYSTAMGVYSEASGDYSTSFDGTASGWSSIALGGTASGTHSVSIGAARASGSYSIAMGSAEAYSYGETAIGRYTTEYIPNSTTDFDPSDRLFTIGNGYATDLGSGTVSITERNALTILKNGNMSVGGEVSVEDNGGALNLIGSDHVYMQWYPDGLAAGRKGYTGWSSATSENYSIVSEVANAHIVLSTAGGGNVGIQTNSPTQAKLVVNGSVGNSLGAYGFLNSSGNTGTSSGAGSYSIFANGHIATSEINVFSDERIKNIQGISNSTSDLALLSKIEVTDYTLKDTIANGNASLKKVIAQQVKEVYPQAISSTLSSVIPDIYRLSKIEDGWVLLASDLKVGEKVRLIFEENEKLVAVEETSSKGFRVNLEYTGQVFVYGKEVDDFHTVDYEAIAMLNVSATQELAKRLIKLEKEKSDTAELVRSLEEKVNVLAEKVTAMESDQGNFNSTASIEAKKEVALVQTGKD